ncbi:hypothetical protein [Curvibacter lanceolatus]|uniref:hypothetical protein n=1 Tax=Curvibacter lanceolatus TaxID=86182 RepID=UPI00036AA5B0|nr:hypothetical protein [Curvibacter lanceolatus]
MLAIRLDRSQKLGHQVAQQASPPRQAEGDSMRATTNPPTPDPEFADDYVVHQPSQYSVTRGVTSTGEVLYLLTFIDSMLVPVISGDHHSAREQKLIRTTVQMSKSFF